MEQYKSAEKKNQESRTNVSTAGKISVETKSDREKEDKELMKILRRPCSKKMINALMKQAIVGLDDEKLKKLIYREMKENGATTMEEAAKLTSFLKEERERQKNGEMKEVYDPTEGIEIDENEEFSFTPSSLEEFKQLIKDEITKEMEREAEELLKEKISNANYITLCPICNHDIHILPKPGERLYKCHATTGLMGGMYIRAKEIIFSGEAGQLRVWDNCLGVINYKGDAIRIETFDIKDVKLGHGWELLP